jgi:hypothetical protein
MEHITQLAAVVRQQGETLALQQLQLQAMQSTSDNVWVLGRAFSVLTMVRLAFTDVLEQTLQHLSRSCAASWVSRMPTHSA